MRARQLDKNGPQAPVICLGAWPLSVGTGMLDESQVTNTIHAADEVQGDFHIQDLHHSGQSIIWPLHLHRYAMPSHPKRTGVLFFTGQQR